MDVITTVKELSKSLWAVVGMALVSLAVTAHGANVSGVVWVDSNGDGVRQGGEERVSGVRVRLYFDKNGEGLVERILQTTLTNGNGEYAFGGLGVGKYQVGLDHVSGPDDSGLPDDLYNLTTQNVGNDESVDSDGNRGTTRTEPFVITNAGQSLTNLSDLGLEQGTGFGDGVVRLHNENAFSFDRDAYEYVYQDTMWTMQDMQDNTDAVNNQFETDAEANWTFDLNPNTNPQAFDYASTWIKWYNLQDRILQEAEQFDDFIDPNEGQSARRASYFYGNNGPYTLPFATKQFLTQHNLSSFANSRSTSSFGFPVDLLYSDPDVALNPVNHHLMFYEGNRGSNPPWKFRGSWPWGARLTAFVGAGMTTHAIGGDAALYEAPDAGWNMNIWLSHLEQWESQATLPMEDAFPIENIHDIGEPVNHFSDITFANPLRGGFQEPFEVRGIFVAILMNVLIDFDRETMIEALHNLSSNQWYTPSFKRSLIDFKVAVLQATDEQQGYRSKFENDWRFPVEDTYNDTRAVDSGSAVQDIYRWDAKPHTYDPANIRSGYGHLADRTSQGVVRWVEDAESKMMNVGAIDGYASNLTYPNTDGKLIVGEHVLLQHDVSNGTWLVTINASAGTSVSFENDQLVSRFNSEYTVNVLDGRLDIRFTKDKIELYELVLEKQSSAGSAGTLINVDWGDGSAVQSGAAAIGSSGDAWNHTDPASNNFADLTNVLDASGTATSVDVTWTDELQSDDNPAAIEFGSSGHNALMEDFAITAPGNTATVTIAELPANLDYTLHLYGVPDQAGQDTTFQVNGADQGAQTVTAGNLADDNGLNSPDDYVVFTGNTGESGTIVYTQTGSSFSGSNGFQLNFDAVPVETTYGTLINVDWGSHWNGGSPVYSGAAVLGSAGDFWNHTTPALNRFADLTNVRDASGTMTLADITWSNELENSYNPGAIEFGSTGHNALMEDYAFTLPDTTATVTIAELPANVDYSLYLFGVPDQAGQDTTFEVSGADQGAQTVTVGNIADDDGLNNPDDYVVFTGNTGGSGTIVYTQTGSSFSGSNGFQLSFDYSDTYTSWAAANSSSADPGEDSNDNGVPNGIEFFLGGTQASPATLPDMVNDSGAMTWTIPYTPWTDAAWWIETSETLPNSSWTKYLPGSEEVTILTNPDRIEFKPSVATKDRLFFQLVVNFE